MAVDIDFKMKVLADLFLNYQEEGPFKEFAEYNDIGLHVAHLVTQGLCVMQKEAEIYVEETYSLLVDSVGAERDKNFSSFSEMLEDVLKESSKGNITENVATKYIELDDDEFEGTVVYDVISDTPDYSYSVDIKDDEVNDLEDEDESLKPITDLELAGHISVTSASIIIGDPCYLDNWDTNKADSSAAGNHTGLYSYEGACEAALSENGFGSLNSGMAVALSTGYGDGHYPVYVQRNDEDRIALAIIDFTGGYSLTN